MSGYCDPRFHLQPVWNFLDTDPDTGFREIHLDAPQGVPKSLGLFAPQPTSTGSMFLGLECKKPFMMAVGGGW